MFTFLRCVAEACVIHGRSPGPRLTDLASDAFARLREQLGPGDLLAELEQLARAADEEVRWAAAEVAHEVAVDQAEADRLVGYLSQVPSAVRRAFRRPDDPSGRSVPPGFAVEYGEDLLAFLPGPAAESDPPRRRRREPPGRQPAAQGNPVVVLIAAAVGGMVALVGFVLLVVILFGGSDPQESESPPDVPPVTFGTKPDDKVYDLTRGMDQDGAHLKDKNGVYDCTRGVRD
jgi:hypothetical protein